jgi:hypothetical protein
LGFRIKKTASTEEASAKSDKKCHRHYCETFIEIKKSVTNNYQNKMQKNNPLHGIKLVEILEFLEKEYGWEELGRKIDIRCFNFDPSVKSSLKFLRKTPWARKKVETLYLDSI